MIPTRNTPLVWSDELLLGFGPMDATHQEFYRVAFDLLTCDENNMKSCLVAFEGHARMHFEQEDTWMRESKFPASECHIDEHAAVLKSVVEVLAVINDGSAGSSLVHDLANHLFEWFPGHADYLDSALASWMSKHNFGGAPVVLKRKHIAS